MKVIHKHRVGDKALRSISELVIIEGQPKALLGWINFGGVRTPDLPLRPRPRETAPLRD